MTEPIRSIFEELVGRTTEAFLSEDVGRRSFVTSTDDPQRFAHIISFDALSKILEDQRLEWPRLRLARDGGVQPEGDLIDAYTSKRGLSIPRLAIPRMMDELEDGSTLVFDSIDKAHPPVGELARAMERELGESVQVNLYAAIASQRNGFDVHWDSHDVLILQVDGRKKWEVRGPSMLHPTRFDKETNTEPSTDIVWSGYLNPGEVLFIPRGWWHQAWPDGEPTMHLTFGFPHRTWIDVLEWLKSQALSREFFRQDVVQTKDWGAFTAQVAALLEERDLDDFLLDHDAASHPRRDVRLRRRALDAGELKWCGSRHSRLVQRAGDDFFTIGARGELWDFDLSLLPLFERLLSAPLTLQQCHGLAGDIDHDELDGFLEELVDNGLIIVS